MSNIKMITPSVSSDAAQRARRAFVFFLFGSYKCVLYHQAKLLPEAKTRTREDAHDTELAEAYPHLRCRRTGGGKCDAA